MKFGHPERTAARVEPATQVYSEIAAALSRISEGLKGGEEEAGKADTAESIQKIEQFRQTVEKLNSLAAKQQDPKASGEMSREDYDYLNNLDNLFLSLLSGRDRPIVADVLTEPNSKTVLEEATGYPLEDAWENLLGARFSCYEFKHPMDNRLTDETWGQMLRDGKAPGSLTLDIDGGSIRDAAMK